jgi:hypothetical protein
MTAYPHPYPPPENGKDSEVRSVASLPEWLSDFQLPPWASPPEPSPALKVAETLRHQNEELRCWVDLLLDAHLPAR